MEWYAEDGISNLRAKHELPSWGPSDMSDFFRIHARAMRGGGFSWLNALSLAAIAMLCLLGAVGAQPAPLPYTVSASFGDGGSASGHFTFDADNSTYSNVAITISNSATP